MPSYTLPTLPRYLQLYYYFRSLRLPLRRRYFVGQDLSGNTYWEVFLGGGSPTGQGGGSRPRRVVSFCGDMREKMAEGVQSPQWSQWLRGLRGEAPSVEELLLDERRRVAVQVHAAREREKEKERAMVVEKRASLKLAQEGQGAGGGRTRRLLGSVGVVGERLASGDSVRGGAEVPTTVEKAQAHAPGEENSRAQRERDAPPQAQGQSQSQSQDPWETARKANEVDQAPSWSPTAAQRR